MAADREIEVLRAARREMLMASGMEEETLMSLMLALESDLPYNCEHSVPRSWFGRRSPMNTDIHHLFTCEPSCNQYRSNIPFGVFSSGGVFREDCGRADGSRFEPLEGRGAVARATLYFLIRYPGEIGDRSAELRRDRLSVLKDWHRAEPPGLWEKHRNRGIAAVQGNRNPLIDFPDWIDHIDFDRGFGG